MTYSLFLETGIYQWQILHSESIIHFEGNMNNMHLIHINNALLSKIGFTSSMILIWVNNQFGPKMNITPLIYLQ